MKALQITGWKQPPELKKLKTPRPLAGQVLVRIGGAGACHSDLHLINDFDEGMMPFEPPFTLGHENAGWIEELGDGVTGLEVGEGVAVYGPWGCGRCRNCRRGIENYCENQTEIGVAGGGLGLDGGMAEYMLVPSPRHLVSIGDLDPAIAAPLTDAGLTPYHAVKRSLHLLRPGSNAVVIGVGGLGHMAVQFIRELSPARVIAVDQREDSLKLAKLVGADKTVVSSDSSIDEIAEFTSGRHAEVVIDFVGSDETLALGAAVTRPLGHLTVVGLAGGTLPLNFFGIGYEASVATTYWGSIPELIDVIELARTRSILPHIERFTLDQAPCVYESLAEGAIKGRAVVVPQSTSRTVGPR